MKSEFAVWLFVLLFVLAVLAVAVLLRRLLGSSHAKMSEPDTTGEF